MQRRLAESRDRRRAVVAWTRESAAARAPESRRKAPRSDRTRTTDHRQPESARVWEPFVAAPAAVSHVAATRIATPTRSTAPPVRAAATDNRAHQTSNFPMPFPTGLGHEGTKNTRHEEKY